MEKQNIAALGAVAMVLVAGCCPATTPRQAATDYRRSPGYAPAYPEYDMRVLRPNASFVDDADQRAAADRALCRASPLWGK